MQREKNPKLKQNIEINAFLYVQFLFSSSNINPFFNSALATNPDTQLGLSSLSGECVSCSGVTEAPTSSSVSLGVYVSDPVPQIKAKLNVIKCRPLGKCPKLFTLDFWDALPLLEA